jgi:hypothetical protein
MDEIKRFLDGRCFLDGHPLRSWRFVLVTVLGVVAIAVSIIFSYIHQDASRHRFAWIGFATVFSIQLVSQWFRALRYYSRIRSLCSGSKADTAERGANDLALRIAAGGLTDFLYYYYGLALTILVFLILFTHHQKTG